MNTSWRHALDVRRSPALPSIAAIGIMLLVLFLLWMFAAQSIYTGLSATSCRTRSALCPRGADDKQGLER